MKITTVSLDLAKNVFHAVCFDEHSKEVKKRMLRRNQLRIFFTQLPPCKVGMEACAVLPQSEMDFLAVRVKGIHLPTKGACG